jgi:hypothetical protein
MAIVLDCRPLDDINPVGGVLPVAVTAHHRQRLKFWLFRS